MDIPDDCWPPAFAVAYFKLIHRLDSARRRLFFMEVLHSPAEIACCAMRAIQAMEALGETLNECVPELEVPAEDIERAAARKAANLRR